MTHAQNEVYTVFICKPLGGGGGGGGGGGSGERDRDGKRHKERLRECCSGRLQHTVGGTRLQKKKELTGLMGRELVPAGFKLKTHSLPGKEKGEHELAQ